MIKSLKLEHFVETDLGETDLLLPGGFTGAWPNGGGRGGWPPGFEPDWY